MSDEIVVRRNNDDSLLMSTFGEAVAGLAKSTNPLPGSQFTDEPWDYIPPAGVSTYRGSRIVNTPDGAPYGSPFDVVQREIRKNPMLREADIKDIHPYKVIEKTNMSQIHTSIDGAFSPAAEAPTQDDSIPEEYKEVYDKMMKERACGCAAANGMVQENVVAPSAVIRNPRQFVTEDIPSSHPVPPVYHSEPKPHVLPPTQDTKPVQITSDMIVKMNGYNETNMYLLTEVSKNIALCSEMISKLNNLQQPVDLMQVLNLLNFIDQTTLRKTLANVFDSVLKDNMALSTEISKYLSGSAVVEDSGTTSESGSGTEEPSQNASGDSLSPDQSTTESGE